MLISAACDRPYAGGGHVLDFCNKAFELLEWVGADRASQILPLVLPGLVGARGGEEDAAWRYPIDIIPPLREAEAALPDLMRQGQGRKWSNGGAMTDTLLGDDPLAILDVLRRALGEGATPLKLSKGICYAAAMRLARFALSNDVRDWFNPLHTFTYCNAVQRCVARSPTPDVVRSVFHGAIAVYMDRFLNVPPAKLPGQRRSLDDLPTNGAKLLDQLLEALDQKHEVEEAARLVARYARLSLPLPDLIDRLTFATVREDLDFHPLQVLESGVRQVQLWPPGSTEAEHILVGVTRYLAAHCPTQRGGLQTARVALRLHRGDAVYEDEQEDV